MNTSLPQMVGLCGPREVGKSTLARYLVSDLGYVRMSMAAQLKRAVALTYKIDPTLLDDMQYKQSQVDWLMGRQLIYNLADMFGLLRVYVADAMNRVVEIRGSSRLSSPREALQIAGTDILRAIDPEIHVKTFVAKATECLDSGARIVSDDVRFPNEVKMMQSLNSCVIWIHRVGHTPSGSDHESDKAINSQLFKNHFLIRGSEDQTARDFERYLGTF